MESRPATTQIQDRVVEKIVEKIVYVERPQPASDIEQDVSEHESIEETFDVIGRVKVAQSEVVIPKDAE